MSEEKRRVPKLRFPGFTDEWEQRKFMLTFQPLQNNSLGRVELNYDTGQVKNIHYGDVLIKFGEVLNIKYEELPFITKEDFVVGSTSLLKNGDVIIADAAEDETVGKCSEINGINDDNVVSGLHTIPCRPTIPFAAGYLGYYMNSHAYHDQLLPLIQGTKISSISKRALQNTDILFPRTNEEQSQIGTFFYNLDHLITLHQRKSEHLQKLKKSLLQKMFPKKGEKVPELRFPGFTDTWEQRKLGDVFQEYSEKKHEELPVLTIIQGGGTILREKSDRNLQYDKSSLSNYKMVKKNDFIVHLRSFEGGLEKANSDGIISPAYHTFHGVGTDSRFYYSYFRSQDFIKIRLLPHVYGIRDGRSIDIEGMKTIDIPFTSYEEQKRIGNFIESLDNLITLHQRKLEHVKDLKKGLSQQMFI